MERPVRVLHAVVNMNRGGAETLLMNLYRHTDRTKVQFDFLTSKEGSFDQEIMSLGGRIHRIPYIDQVGHRGYCRALRQFFQSNDEYSIVHSHMDRMSGLVLRAARKYGVAAVRIAHSHNTRSEGGTIVRLYKWLAGLPIRSCATHRFACSFDAARWLFPKREHDTTIVKNGVDPDCFLYSAAIRSAVRQELAIEPSTLVIGHVGRFNHQKNHALLLDIFKAVKASTPNSMLLMAGDGPLREAMEEKAQALGISESIRFLGVRTDIERLLMAFDMFVFPSHHEGLPVTLVEAQAAGLPCIVSDTISSEADLGFVQFISNLAIDEYVKRIGLAAYSTDRLSTRGLLISQGYDIRTTALWLQGFYSGEREVKHEKADRVYANV